MSQISHIIFEEKNLSCEEISDFCKEFEQFMGFYRNLCRFCSKFVWSKNHCGENICGEKKTNMRSAFGLQRHLDYPNWTTVSFGLS